MLYKICLIIVIIFTAISCNKESVIPDGVHFITTNHPISTIMQEIAGDSSEVSCLISPGTSMHMFTPRPSDIEKLEKATGVLYVADNLDGWMVNVKNTNKFKLIDNVPDSDLIYSEHSYGPSSHKNLPDPHIWTDPVIVRELVPKIAAWMAELNPEDSIVYLANASKVIKKLDDLHNEFISKTEKYRGRSVMLYHPSFLYFLKRYGLKYAGSVEEFPGKEPTFRDLTRMKKKVEKLGITILYVEPYVPERINIAMAEALNVRVLYLISTGGIGIRYNYFKLMRLNIKNLLKGFR